MKNKFISALIVLCCLLTNAYANNVIHMVKPDDELKWINMPNTAGQYAVLAGDPTKKEWFIVRVKFPANYMIAVHSHDHDEYDTVIAGSCYIAKGTVLNKKNGMLATPGTFVSIPPHLPHYGWTGSEGAVIQLSGMGPWKPKYE